MVDKVLKFDVKDCNYVRRWSQILLAVATGRTRGNGCKLEHGKSQLPLTTYLTFFPFYCIGGQILAKVTQESCGTFIPGNIQNSAG